MIISFSLVMKTLLCLSVTFLLTIAPLKSIPPSTDVFQALRFVCTGKFQGDACPYVVAYDIATQLAGQWDHGDGGSGLWSDGSPSIWWPSGVGLWALAEFFHAMHGRGEYLPERIQYARSTS